MRPILLILTAFCTQCSTAQISFLPAFQWRIDTSSGAEQYIWPEVCDEFVQSATLEEIAIRFGSQSMYGGAQRLDAWHASGQAGNRWVPMTAPMRGVLTDGQMQILVNRMTEEARYDPWMVSELIRLMQYIGPTPSEIPFHNEQLTLTLYEGLVDLPGVAIDEYIESPMTELVSRTPRTDLWVARIQADIEAEQQANGETDCLRFLQMLKVDLGGRSWEEKMFCD